MAKKQVSAPLPAPPARPPYMLIEEIRVQGYKSLVDATLHVRPLTLLAGTNSSGKSSIMQPLLLIKQTMEAPYQPAGALVLDGAHVQADTAGELVSKVGELKPIKLIISVCGFNINEQNIKSIFMEMAYNLVGEINFSIESQTNAISAVSDKKMILKPTMSWNEITVQLTNIQAIQEPFRQLFESFGGSVRQSAGLLEAVINNPDGGNNFVLDGTVNLRNSLTTLFHIPGLRGGPTRSYVATSFQNQVKGTFDIYTAGTISQWQQQENTKALAKLNDNLRRLGLTDSVTAKVKNANEVELSVNRLPAGSKGKPRKADMVNIADVGIGVSQVLPILVALIAAQEGQIVYVEQPELHLHPKAQVVMAELLAEAANRGVRVIVETHSSLLLLTVQTLVAEGELKPEDVGLHWFTRDAKGQTQVKLADVDANGAYGPWPEDFGDVELTAQARYLDAQTRNNIKHSNA